MPNKIAEYTVNICAIVTAGGLVTMHSSLVEAATIQGTAQAQVSTGVVLSQTSELNFGAFFIDGTSGSVTIDAAGNVNSTGGVTLLPGSNPAAGVIAISGVPGRSLNISVPQSFVLSNGQSSMLVTLNANTMPATLPASGIASLNIGGILAVAGNQEGGVYTGSYPIVVNY